MKSLLMASVLLAASGLAVAKLPPAPPVDPAKAEEAKQKEAEAKAKAAELQAKYEDKAVTAFAAKAKAEGKEFKPSVGPGVPGAPPPAPAAATAAMAGKPQAAKK